jgi:hypothetical protein
MGEKKPKIGRPATGQTPGHNVRMSKDRWNRLGDATEKAGTDRSGAINDFAAWYTNEDGAELPERPTPDEDRPPGSCGHCTAAIDFTGRHWPSVADRPTAAEPVGTSW